MGEDAPELEPDHDPADDDRPRLVLVTMGGRRVLVPVETVFEVLVDATVTRLPGSLPAVRGVTSVRGRIVAVVDPVAAGAATDDGHLLVVRGPTGPVALAVDRVHAVVPADPDQPTAADAPPAAAPAPARHATVDDGESLEVVDPVVLLATALGPSDDPASDAPVGATP